MRSERPTYAQYERREIVRNLAARVVHRTLIVEQEAAA